MLNKLLKYSGKPALYEPGTAFMWTDAHISTQLLRVHLDGDVDLASRCDSTINKTVDWMLSQMRSGAQSILDLGCGPGLYAERLAQRGHRVTGVDISLCSIEYARRSAADKGLAIQYRNNSYLSLNDTGNDAGNDAGTDTGQYDVAMLIYTDIGVLLPDERRQVIENVHRVLKPGGIFIFDVLNTHRANEKRTLKNWEISETGFWRSHPYLALSESFGYAEENVILYQHIVSDDNGVDVYRFWTHLFTDKAIRESVHAGGFSSCDCFTDVLPPKDAWSGDNVTFCVARK